MNFWDLLIDQYCHSRYLFSLMVFCLNTDFTKKFPPNCNWNWFKKSHQKSRKISNHNIAQYAFKCEFCFFYFWSKPKSNLKFLATPSISMLDPLSFSNKNKNIWEQWHNLWFWKKKRFLNSFEKRIFEGHGLCFLWWSPWTSKKPKSVGGETKIFWFGKWIV